MPMQTEAFTSSWIRRPVAGPILKYFQERRNPIIACLLAVVAANLWAWGLGRNDVLDAAYSFPDGGGYCALSDSGVFQTIKHNGSVILPASKGGSYCCGFTFQVAMQVAQQRGLLKDKSAQQIRRFQQEWYGSAKGTELKQCAAAVVNLGIGREVAQTDALPGDFVVFNRASGFGHSVVFLNWMTDSKGKIVGLRYRSSQPPNGVGEEIEYFADSGYGDINRKHLFVARLHRRWWSRMLCPLG
jgi:hypothetical protein